MATAYLMTKLKNRICKHIPKENLRFTLKNVSINGEKRGCSGFVTYLPTGRCVYVNTERLVMPGSGDMMYRYAKNEHDFSSSHADFDALNIFTTDERLASEIADALTKPRDQIRTIVVDKVNYR